MHLTLQTDYALRILMYAATFPDRLATTREISDAYGISQNHLVKIINALGHNGYLDLQRGRTGGVALGKAADAITLGEIVRLMEPDLNLAECFDAEHNTCVISPACRYKAALFRARKAFFAELDAVTIADCVEDGVLERFYPTPPLRVSRSSREIRKLTD